jgi:preprotein translocase subunit SecB
MIIKRPKEEFKALARISRSTELTALFLINSQVSRNPKIGSFENIGAEFEHSGKLYQREKDLFKAWVDIAVRGVNKDEEDEPPLVNIQGEYLVTYKIIGDVEVADSDLDVFCSINALYNVWPYFRQHVSSMCNKMYIPQLLLPLLRIFQEKQPEVDNQIDKMVETE